MDNNELLDSLKQQIAALFDDLKAQKENSPLPMGLPEEFSNTTFARKYRWTLEGEHFQPLSVRRVKLCHSSHTLEVDFADMTNESEHFGPLTWLNNLQENRISGEETLTLKTFDGCGNELYRIDLANIKLMLHTVDFDYDNSDLLTRKALLKYEKETIVFNQIKRKQYSPEIKPEELKSRLLENKYGIEETTKVNFLNTSVVLPAKPLSSGLPSKTI